MADPVKLVLEDGSVREIAAPTTGADLAREVGGRLGGTALAVLVDGEPMDLTTPIPGGSEVSLVVPESAEGLEILRHSTSHVMAQAVLDLWPGATFAIGPVIEHGFYYDFDLPDDETFSDADLERIEERMREIVGEDQPFTRSELDREEALELFSDQPYKREIIEGVTPDPMSSPDEGGSVSIYRNRPDFVDLCRGPHVPSTKRLGHFKLMRVAGAYWRGDEHNAQLQRIYGTAWADKKSLAAHLERLEEAAKRDHRKLAVELDLLSFPEELGGGLCVWHPKGATVRRLMEDYSRQRHAHGGYDFVYTPHLADAGLFKTSGHLDWYAESMYPAMEMDNGEYYPKPMNCPMHVLVYQSRQRSYRELPLRLFELGTVYRYERAGTLHGLLRIRGFTQDDSHIFCAPDQAHDEIRNLLSFVLSVLRAFGFEDFEANLATRPEEKYVGTDEGWDGAIEALRAALEAEGLAYEMDEGGGAFYGPKIDIKVRDAIGRQWQLSTIQYDFNLPERFELEYVGADNERHRPIMIHRALFGSIERFFGVLVEHFAGAFPTWLAPVQVRLLGVRDDHDEYAETVRARLDEAGFRADVVGASEPLGTRIRKAKLEKIPYVLVVGDDDVAAETAGVNPRGGEVERNVPISDFIRRLESEVAPYRLPG